MSNIFDSRENSSLTTKVFQYIRDGIIEGRYQTGDYLVETRLAEELGVSRTPVREALKQLELEDLAEAIPNRGVVVKGFSREDIDDIFTIRYLLEGLAAYWAALRIKPQQLEKLSELIELMELYTRRGDSANLTRLDTEFHEVIFTASDSRTLKHILASLHQNIHYARKSSLTSPTRPLSSLKEHKEIYAALLAHDQERAKSCMESHVHTAGDFKSQLIE
ncbi:GntR family transcriptional regulator [Christensenellaceae bacterium OttesenSCG-928-L17]|nr:GntR family transcriptional regulator [Christensenellaceae bacterium OttesenSCG-928-L17]